MGILPFTGQNERSPEFDSRKSIIDAMAETYRCVDNTSLALEFENPNLWAQPTNVVHLDEIKRQKAEHIARGALDGAAQPTADPESLARQEVNRSFGGF